MKTTGLERMGHASRMGMDIWEVDGRLFEVVMVSDVVREGMSLELTDLSDRTGSGSQLEVFYSDHEHTMVFSAFRQISAPMEIVTRFIDEAHRRLPAPK